MPREEFAEDLARAVGSPDRGRATRLPRFPDTVISRFPCIDEKLGLRTRAELTCIMLMRI
jgi:hypothetical protein